MLEQIVDFRLERRVGGGGAIFPLKVQDQRHQRFRDIAAAELAEVAALVRHGPETVGLGAHALLTAFKRSEEHTSELQSLMRISYAVFCLKKKNQNKKATNKT